MKSILSIIKSMPSLVVSTLILHVVTAQWLCGLGIVTGFAYLAVPSLNVKAMYIKRLDSFYAEHLLTSDKKVLQISVIADQLYSKLFGIGCG